jgi:hypothetical protein
VKEEQEELVEQVVTQWSETQAAQSYPVLLITLYRYINSILKIIRKSCVINLLCYILYNSIMKSTYMCFLKDLNENRPRLALILRLTAIVGFDMMINSQN